MDKFTRLAQWFDAHLAEEISIHKHEDGDLDHAKLFLRKVGLAHQRDPENYVAEQALILHGEGMLETATERLPIPLDMYEIPIDSNASFEQEGDSLLIATKRAKYRVQLN